MQTLRATRAARLLDFRVRSVPQIRFGVVLRRHPCGPAGIGLDWQALLPLRWVPVRIAAAVSDRLRDNLDLHHHIASSLLLVAVDVCGLVPVIVSRSGTDDCAVRFGFRKGYSDRVRDALDTSHRARDETSRIIFGQRTGAEDL